MDEIKLNNQIIDMRKFVKQGKLHIISKLVKEVRLLNAKNGNEVQMAENNRRAERLLSEINFLKKINVDSVSKMCLLSEEDWKSKISDNTASLEDCAMARLANFKGIQKEVINFRMKFPHLVKVLPDLIRQWEERKQQQSHEGKRLTASEIKKRNKEKRLKLLEKKEEKSLFPKEHTNNSPNLKDPQFNAEEKEHFANRENSEIENWPNESMENSENQIEIFHDSNEEAVNPEEHEKRFLDNDGESEGDDDDNIFAGEDAMAPQSRFQQNDSEGKFTLSKNTNADDYKNECGASKDMKQFDDKNLSPTKSVQAQKSRLKKTGSSYFEEFSLILKSLNSKELSLILKSLNSEELNFILKSANSDELNFILKSLNSEELTESSEIPVGQRHGKDYKEAEEVRTGKRKRRFLFDNHGTNNSAGNDVIAPQKKFRQNYSKGKFMQSKNTNPGGYNNKFDGSNNMNQFDNKNTDWKSNNNRFCTFCRPDRNFGNQFAQNRRMPFRPSTDFPSGNRDFHSSKRNPNFGNKYQSIAPEDRFQQNNSKEKFMQSKYKNPGGYNNKFRGSNSKPDRKFGNKFAQNRRMPFNPSTDFPSGNRDFHSNNRNSNSGKKFPRDFNKKDW